MHFYFCTEVHFRVCTFTSVNEMDQYLINLLLLKFWVWVQYLIPTSSHMRSDYRGSPLHETTTGTSVQTQLYHSKLWLTTGRYIIIIIIIYTVFLINIMYGIYCLIIVWYYWLIYPVKHELRCYNVTHSRYLYISFQ